MSEHTERAMSFKEEEVKTVPSHRDEHPGGHHDPHLNHHEHHDHEIGQDLDADSLTPQHHAFLMQRHETVDLDPIPAMDDSDPLNWPKRKKVVNLALIAFHAMMATFSSASIQSCFNNIAADLDITAQQASYLASLYIVILGSAPLLWCPVSQVYGRRPIFLLSLVGSCVCNVGCAVSHSYATMGLCRALSAFCISPALSIGSGVVSETFFKRDRGYYMGIWTMMVTLGVPIAPFIFGFVALRVDYRWIYWILAIINGVQFGLYLFLGPETRFVPGQRPAATSGPSFKAQYLTFRRIDPAPLTVMDFLRPLFLVARPCVAIPAVALAMVFLWGSVMPSIEIPQLFAGQFNFNTQQLGLQNIALIVGTVLGEQVGGPASDYWMARRTKKTAGGGEDVQPEHRLWASYIGYVLTMVGLVVFLVQQAHAGTQWNVTPLVGVAIAAAGNQIVTTVLMTYAVDCYRTEADNVGVFMTLVRFVWGFCGPFWFPQMFANVGLIKCIGVTLAMLVAVSVVPTFFVQLRGRRWRD